MPATIDHLPPTATEAEEAVLGSLLMDSEAIDQVRGELLPDDFYREKNATLYRTVLELSRSGQAVDAVMLCEALRQRGTYDETGGLAYLSHLIGVVPTAVHIRHYAGAVQKASVRRRLISATGRIAAAAYDETRDLEDVLTYSVEQLAQVQTRLGGMEIVTPDQQSTLMADLCAELMLGRPPGIPTGFWLFDRLTGGLRPGCLYILGAPTGVGKSSWMQSVARRLRRKDKRVLFASSEMSPAELSKRDMATVLQRDWNDIERALAANTRGIGEDIADAVERLPAVACHVYHEGQMTTDRIRRRAARMQADGGLDCVFVDYLQRLADRDRTAGNREQQVTQIARSLKSMAADLSVPVVVAAQFSRACMSRDNKEPLLSDFRESGSIEQEADVAMGLYRPSYFDDKHDSTEAWLMVLKNRHGPEMKRIEMVWVARMAEYHNLAREER